MIRIVGCGPRLSEIELVRTEKAVGCRLPESYRRFLLSYNGGLPSPDTVRVPGFSGKRTDIQVFFGVDREDESSRLDWNVETLMGRIPDNVFPVACDSGGNIFGIVTSGSETGAIVYRDLEAPEVPVYVVSSGFDQFLEQIRSLDEDVVT